MLYSTSNLPLCLARLLLVLVFAQAKYMPGVNIHSFQEGEDLQLRVNKLTSTSELYDLEYYRFPFCQPLGGPRMVNQNLGEFLQGDRIESSPYIIKMRKDMFCEQVCVANLGRGEQLKLAPNQMVRAIHKGYKNNWIVDNLSAATKLEDAKTTTTRYWSGFPVGYVADDSHKAYINNHVNIELFYHRAPESNAGDKWDIPEYRVVRFIVEPFSIRHDIDLTETILKINNPIASCDISVPVESRPHTMYSMIKEEGRGPQVASGKVLFTYDVIWSEDTMTTWASRWDVYLTMNGAIPSQVHWASIMESMVLILVLGLSFVSILVRQMRRDASGYSGLATAEEQQGEGTNWNNNGARTNFHALKWISVCAHVFRPPTVRPRLLAVACGTGAQLLCTALTVMVLSWLGTLNPSRRGLLIYASLIFFCLCGGTNGYVSARLHKTFDGTSEECHHVARMAAVLYPGIVFGVFLFMNMVAWTQSSSDLVSFWDVCALLFFWLFINTPMVFLGTRLGSKAGPFVEANKVEEESGLFPPPAPPRQPCYLRLPCCVIIGGAAPYWSFHVELWYILVSTWRGNFYYMYGYLLIAFVVMVIVTVEVTVAFTYYHLRHENHNWWWQSFGTAGGIALWVFGHSVANPHSLLIEISSLPSMILFVGYMGVACLGYLCMMGFIGVMASLWFVQALVSFLKLKLGSDVFPEIDREDVDDNADVTVPLMTYLPPAVAESLLDHTTSTELVCRSDPAGDP